jgi:hypothetical protein
MAGGDPTDLLSNQVRSRRFGVVVPLVLLVASFVIGFVLVYTLYRPRPPSVAGGQGGQECVTRAGDSGAEASADGDGGQPTAQTSSGEQPGALEAEAPPEVPPGRTPDGIEAAQTPPRYLKCWTVDGEERTEPDCDSLEILERRFSTRLYVVAACKEKVAGEEAEGTLSLGAQVDFADRSISFWAGPSSEIEQAKAIGTCVREDLAGLPLYGVEHDHEKYTVYFTVTFRDPEEIAAELKRLRRRGRTVAVTMDRVRVRIEPVDGHVVGHISSDSEVTFLERKDDWCRVLTPKDNKGWMICAALDL